MLWKLAEANEIPIELQTLPDGRIIVRKNITSRTTEEGNIVYKYEERVMQQLEYAVVEAVEAKESKREAEIVDEYTLKLIEEGVL